ncbi:MAG TPA: transcriptional regulator GutM [Candidatus Agrococcus pullicola]|uniref:Transcriptional regulator GutM n=1 Tax=Candidatus Agrococcus pullicola TaxID=2838429 RepID=A0A9D1YVE5_9MICO|nr:transcriptional regulator GutM [Candidatus Agrococcus pullicola]
MDWGFALILIGALGLVGLTSVFQYRRMLADIESMRVAHADRKGAFLVSGRHKGFIRGAVVALVIDGHDERIVEARAMRGISALSRLRRRESLEGNLGSVAFRESDAAVIKAVEAAEAEFRRLQAQRKRAPRKRG